MNHFGTPGVASRWSVGLQPTWTGLAMCVVLGALCSWAGRSMAKGESTSAAAEGRALVALRVNVTGQGAVRSESGIDCGAVCRTRLPAGTSVVLNAEPAVGQRFVGWTGACSGAAACSVTLEQTQLVGAIFSPIPAARLSERPYLFKADEVRLRASMAANDPEAFGSTQNIPNAPIGFLTLAQAAYGERLAAPP